MEDPFLSILIPTVGSRQEKFLELLRVVLPQAEDDGRAEVVGLYNNGEHRLPVIRQRLLEEASGEFVAYIDDDDMVSDDYVATIIDTLKDPDHWYDDTLGFRVHLAYKDQMSVCSREQFTSRECAAFQLHEPAEMAARPEIKLWYHDWGIMIPTRADIARRCRFDSYLGRVGEDGWFKQQLLPQLSGEAYVDRVLYHYRWDPENSVQSRMPPHQRLPRPEVASGVFRWHPWSAR